VPADAAGRTPAQLLADAAVKAAVVRQAAVEAAKVAYAPTTTAAPTPPVKP
jgi:hypothetical protein